MSVGLSLKIPKGMGRLRLDPMSRGLSLICEKRPVYAKRDLELTFENVYFAFNV